MLFFEEYTYAHALDGSKLISVSSEKCLNFTTLQNNERMIWLLNNENVPAKLLLIYATSLQNAHSSCPMQSALYIVLKLHAWLILY